MAKIKRTENTGKEIEKPNLSYIVGWSVKCHSHFGNKGKHKSTLWATISTPWYFIQEKWKHMSTKKHLYKNGHSLIPNNRKLETAQNVYQEENDLKIMLYSNM